MKCNTETEVQEMIAKYEAENGVKLHEHHDAWARGYISRKIAAEVYSYEGKFGKGLIVCRPSRRSTQYYVVEYMVSF